MLPGPRSTEIPESNRPRRAKRRAAILCCAAAALMLSACSTTPAPAPTQRADTSKKAVARALATERRAAARNTQAKQARIEQLEAETKQLRLDLARAEDAMKAGASESGRANRAGTVSKLAEARISLEQAEASVSWRPDELAAGRQDLAEAERQLAAGRSPSVVYFASRGQETAIALLAEAQRVQNASNALFVQPSQLNLRAAPSGGAKILVVLQQGTPVFSEGSRDEWTQVRTLSGTVGWVYASLLSRD